MADTNQATIKEKSNNDNEEMEIETLPDRPKSYFGSRHIFGFMGFLGLTVCYLMRSNLSVAIVVMINSTSTDESSLFDSESYFFGNKMHGKEKVVNGTSNGTCSNDGSSANINTRGEFNWNSEEKGLVLGAFYWGFIATQILGGVLAERFGGKWVVGTGILLADFFSLISPEVARSGGYVALIIVRVLTGLSEGVVFPALISMVSKWVPSTERSTIGAFVLAGTLFGTIISFPLSGWLCDMEFDNGWPLTFYVPGAIGIIWFVFWFFLVYDNPTVHPRIDEDEKRYILATSGKSANRSISSAPWIKIATSIHVWAIFITHFGQNWGFSMLLSQLPTYMNAVLHFDIKANGLLSALPYIAQWVVSFTVSIIADGLIKKKILSVTATRKIFTTMGLSIPACGLIAATFTGCDPIGTVILLTLTSGFNGANNSGLLVNPMDIASNYAGTVMGVSNTIANTCGFIVPAVVGAIVTNEQSLSQWQTVFFISAGVYLGATLVYVTFASGEEQPWNARIDLPLEREKVSHFNLALEVDGAGDSANSVKY